MGELVDQDQIIQSHKRGNDAKVRQIAGAKHAGVLRLFDAGQAALELGEQRVIAGNEARSACSHAVKAQGLARRLDHGRVVREVEVIVAAEGQQAPAIAQGPNPRHPDGVDERAPQAARFELGKLCGREFIE